MTTIRCCVCSKKTRIRDGHRIEDIERHLKRCKPLIKRHKYDYVGNRYKVMPLSMRARRNNNRIVLGD